MLIVFVYDDGNLQCFFDRIHFRHLYANVQPNIYCIKLADNLSVISCDLDCNVHWNGDASVFCNDFGYDNGYDNNFQFCFNDRNYIAGNSWIHHCKYNGIEDRHHHPNAHFAVPRTDGFK